MRSLFLGLVLILAGCVTVEPVYLADGTQGHNIGCKGAAQSFADCLAKAGEICGAKGYTVVNREGEAIPYSAAGGSFSGNQGAFYGQSGSVVNRNLFIKCKP